MRQEADEGPIVAAVQAAEEQTSGQIVCVLARQSCDSGAHTALFAAVLALLAPAPMLALTQFSAQRIFTAQAALFLAALLLFGWTRLGLALTPRAEQRRQAFRAAIEQFHLRGLTRTHNRAGVLIFVSLAERYARIVADDGLSSKVSEAEWRKVMEGMTAHLREGRITEAYVAAVQQTAALLAPVAPPDGGGNELPDGLVRV